MTVLLIFLATLALLDLAALVRWLRADGDGRPPPPPASASPYARSRNPRPSLRRRMRQHWQAQLRLWEIYGNRFEPSGVETCQAARRLRWLDDRLVGDLLPPPAPRRDAEPGRARGSTPQL